MANRSAEIVSWAFWMARSFWSRAAPTASARNARCWRRREGAKVVVNDLGGGVAGGDEGSAGPAEQVAQEIRKAGGEAVSNSDSVTSRDGVKRMIEQAMDSFKGLHAIISPAGILRDTMFHKMTDQDWDSGHRGASAGQLQCLPRRDQSFPRAERRLVRALHLDVRPHRQYRPGELRRREDGHRRPVAHHRHGRRCRRTCAPTSSRRSRGRA